MVRPRVPPLSAVFQPPPGLASLDHLVDAGANAWDLYLGGGVADVHPTAGAIVDEGPQRTVTATCAARRVPGDYDGEGRARASRPGRPASAQPISAQRSRQRPSAGTR